MRAKIRVHPPALATAGGGLTPAPATAGGRLTLARALSPFLSVLSLSGMSCASLSDDGRVSRSAVKLIWTAALLVLTCASTGMLCSSLCLSGVVGVSGAGVAGFTRVMVRSAFFGLAVFLFALPTGVALTLGNHRLTAFLRRFQETCGALQVVGDYQSLLRRIRRIGRVLAIVLIIANCGAVLGISAAVIPDCATLSTRECFKNSLPVVLFAVPWMIFNTMSFKVVFFAMCFSRCFDLINRKLRSLDNQFENDFTDRSDAVHFLFVTHRRLSQTYQSLLRAATAELVPYMFFGAVGPVYFSMLGFIMVSDAIGAGQWSGAVFGLVTCMLGGVTFVVAIFLPCEASQRVINSADRIRDTVWELRINNEHLEKQVRGNFSLRFMVTHSFNDAAKLCT